MKKRGAILEGLIDSKKSVRNYRDKIDKQLKLVKRSMVDIGRILNEAENNLSKKDYRELETGTELGKRSIQKLKKIAADMRIEKHKDELPGSWGTLYEITKLNDKEFNESLKQGVIR